MFVVFYLCFLVGCVIFVFFSIWFKWMKRNLFSYDREKSSSFECGFDGNKSTKNPFSFRFFYFLILFLMFDIELSLFLVLPFNLFCFGFGLKVMIIFSLMMLLFGLLIEWYTGALKWKN